MVTFKLGSHIIRGQAVQMVEVWRDGTFVATIYPHEAGLHVVSKYIQWPITHIEMKALPPSVIIRLKPEVNHG